MEDEISVAVVTAPFAVVLFWGPGHDRFLGTYWDVLTRELVFQRLF